MIADSEILGNFTKEDIKNEFDKLKDDEELLIIITDYRDLYPIRLLQSDILEFEYYCSANARPGSPAAKRQIVECVITRDGVEFRFPLNGVLGLKIKKIE